MTSKTTFPQLRILRAARLDGRVEGTRSMIRKLVSAGLATRPVRIDSTHAYASITDAGRAAVAAQEI